MAYERGDLVAQTGQAFVYRGSDESTGEVVAIKVLDTSTASRNTVKDFARFRRELRVQQELADLPVMPIYALDMESDPPSYVMPWAGRTLRDYILSNDAESHDDALSVFYDILVGVAAVHDRGVIHRDLKPENILLLEDRWVLADFGMCRELDSSSATITSTTIGLGTVEYCSPEQVYDAHAADYRSDVYSLGKILYQLLTGKTPYPSVRIDLVPIRFRYIVSKATKEEPERRYQTAADLLSDLDLLLRPVGHLLAPVDVAKQAHDDLLAGDPDALAVLNRTLLSHQDDEVLYTSLVPYLSETAIAAYATTDPSDFSAIVLAFDRHVDGHLDFEYTDKVALFLEKVFAHVADPQVREVALRRVLLMGYSHNRYAVRDVFCRLSRACIGGPETLVLVGLLRDNPDAAAFMGERLRRESLPQIVLEAIPAGV